MILVDSTVLVALCNSKDALWTIATSDLRSLDGEDLLITIPVLTEAWHLLRGPRLRTILLEWMRSDQIELSWPVEDEEVSNAVFQWLSKYADHDPDFADAYLVIAASCINARVWTYDSEFYTTWRRPDGTAVPVAVPMRTKGRKNS